MTTSPKDAQYADPDRRNSSRLTPDSPTTIRLSAGDRRYDCEIEDISLTGIRLRLISKVPAAGMVELEHETAGRFKGKQVWRSHDAIGIAFELPERRLERALQCISVLVNPDLDLTVY
jgi:hypothetical protein